MAPAWVNMAVMVAAGTACWGLYLTSVSPVCLSRRMGAGAYRFCKVCRYASVAMMAMPVVNYMLYLRYPLAMGIPEKMPWPWWVSLLAAAAMAAPATWLILRGISDAGAETMSPGRAKDLYGGIYQHMRHPQVTGAILLWVAMAVGLHSPLLVIISALTVPAWLIICLLEERDLLLRFGDKYRGYRRQVPLLPLIRRRPL
jgi:protein-S-isoprenylcysteine O-methyltransferase Ste14